jgi:hypothetical protein
MRFSEFKTVEQNILEGATAPSLQWGQFSKKGRLEANVATFIKKVENGEPFMLLTGQQFVVDNTPENLNLVRSWQGGTAPKLAGHMQGDPKAVLVGMNKFAKTQEFGGMAAGAGQEAGKEQMLGRTAHLNLHDISKEEEKAIGDIKTLISDKGISGKDLTSKIINNPVLQSEDPHGKWIIEIAKNIEAKQYPVPVPEGVLQDKKYRAFIQDYAGEYLGIAGLTNGLGDFPKLGAFLNFLGAKSMEELQYYFPMSENSPLADSFGFIKSPSGEHQMYLSSKGGTRGAAPSMTNLKIPEGMQPASQPQEEAMNFLRIIQENSQIEGTLKALNFLGEINAKELVDQKLAALLPITDEEIAFFADNYSSDVREMNIRVEDAPERLQDYIQSRVVQGGVKVVTGDFIMACTTAVIKSINAGRILPDFESLAKELLGYNFVQIFTQIKARPPGMQFRVLWPAKIDGTVESYSNSSQKDLKGKLGFRIH